MPAAATSAASCRCPRPGPPPAGPAPGCPTATAPAPPLDQVAALLHRGPIGLMCSPLTNPTGTLAPTQTGKSRADLVHKVLATPGALLCSTTKPDLLEFAALARTRRRAGPVLVFDATATTRWPAQLRWSPISGCHDLRTAYQRAHTLVEAAAVNLTAVNSGNDRVFRERATMVIAAYLLAAELHGRGVGALVRWAIGKPPPANRRTCSNRTTRSWPTTCARRSPWWPRPPTRCGCRSAGSSSRCSTPPSPTCAPRDPATASTPPATSPRAAACFIAGQHQAAHAVPILTALAEHWLTTAQQMALQYPTRRLDPPATAILDELPNATPIPRSSPTSSPTPPAAACLSTGPPNPPPSSRTPSPRLGPVSCWTTPPP